MKKILISGTASGTGKTTITLAIEAALCRRGLVVQPFKCGPDYLDTTHHTAICGRSCRNLDTVMLSVEENRASLERASQGAGIAIAEGMMGLFDGLSGGSDQGSSAEIAKTLHFPVLLVMDASSCSRSIAATLLGFSTFDKELKIAGVILNRVSGESHFQMLAEAIKGSVDIPIIGWLPKNSAVTIPERHLGLHDAHEQAWTGTMVASLADFAEQHLNLDRMIEIAAAADTADALPTAEDRIHLTPTPVVRIGVARDEAFSFYYEDNFDLLRDYGAEIVEFSPLHDERLPENVDALYIGGGYPELHAGVLNSNHSMIASVREYCRSGRPVYAECGGMMFLAESIVAGDVSYPMAGVLPLQIEMSSRLVKFGYVKVSFIRDCILGPAGTEAIGHSFHYSKIQAAAETEMAYALQYLRAGRMEEEGYAIGNVLASYVHLHFRTNRQLPNYLIHAALTRKQVSLSTP
jgi:cobyrinic acid a,c-diamide synthase